MPLMIRQLFLSYLATEKNINPRLVGDYQGDKDKGYHQHDFQGQRTVHWNNPVQSQSQAVLYRKQLLTCAKITWAD